MMLLLNKLLLNNDAIAPHDPVGIAPSIAQSEKSRGRDSYDYSRKSRKRIPNLCVEFKLSVGKFLEELSRKTGKDPAAIDILISWDAQIPNAIPRTSYTWDEVPDSQRQYHGATHRLGIIGLQGTNGELYCIQLKDILNKMP